MGKITVSREEFIASWRTSCTLAEVAGSFGWTKKKVRRIARKYREEGVKLKKFPNGLEGYTPCPDEIARETAKIRNRWSDDQLNRNLRADQRYYRVEISRTSSHLISDDDHIN